jgi:hypothetical protein
MPSSTEPACSVEGCVYRLGHDTDVFPHRVEVRYMAVENVRIIYRRLRAHETEEKVNVRTFVTCATHVAEYEARVNTNTHPMFDIREMMRLGTEDPCQSCTPNSDGDLTIGWVIVDKVET